MNGLITSSCLVLLLSAFLAGCPAPEGEADRLSGQKTDLGDKLQEDVYRFPLPSNPMSLDPAHITDTVSDSVAKRIFDGLVRFDHDGKLTASIAERWEASEDGKVWTFHLREDVRFHNGREVKADDFEFSLTRLLDPDTRSERAGLLYPIKGARAFFFTRTFHGRVESLIENQGDVAEFHEALASIEDTLDYIAFSEGTDATKAGALLDAAVSAGATGLGDELVSELRSLAANVSPPARVVGIEVVSDFTLKIALEVGYTPFLMVLGMTNCYVVPREEVEKLGDDFGILPVGSGTFVFQSWEPDVSILLSANRDHFRKPPGIDKLLYRIIADENTRFEEFKNGQLEHTDVPSGRIEEVRRDPALAANLIQRATMDMYGYAFNCSAPPFKDNKLLRQAINHAIDKDNIIENILEGKFERMNSFVPDGTFHFWADAPGYDYDVEKAESLLSQAGYPGGEGLPAFTLNIDNQEFRNKIAVAVQEDLRQIGIDIEIDRKDWGSFLEQVYSGETIFCQNTWLADYPDPDNWLFTLLDSSQAGAPGNIARYSNPDFDKLVRKAQRIVPEDERDRLYQRAEEIAYEDAPWVLLFVNSPVMLIQPYVKEFKLTPMDRAPQLTNCPIEDIVFSRE